MLIDLRLASVALTASIVGVLSVGVACAEEAVGFASSQAVLGELQALGEIADAEARSASTDALWTRLTDAGQVPYTHETRFVFLYRGDAETVGWAGDHNGWDPSKTPGVRVPGTDVWHASGELPADARIDYKVVLNGKDWRLDPVNPHTVWSGFGPNSELRMPRYRFPAETLRRPDVARGELGDPKRIASERLGYDVGYRVYRPAKAHEPAKAVIYVTDGHEYAADDVGALVVTLDNLIASREVRPAVAVFVDPRDPDNLGRNRRAEQYVGNEAFVEFLASELAPNVEAAVGVTCDREDRVLLGTSLGGLLAAYAGALRPDVFGALAIQSPAFQVDRSIYDRYDRPPGENAPKMHLAVGAMNDGEGGPRLREILQRHGYNFDYLEVNQGHSWGSWRGQLPTMLRELVGPPEPSNP